MAKTKISEFSTTAGNNTDINSINIAEGCAPSGINDAIRELMRQLKEFQTGGAGDSVNSGGDFSVATNKFTVASASGNTAVAGTLAVTGTTTLTGALVANGNATLGDGSGDTVTVKGTPTLEVNPTLSGGTANGVLYLNGSKVATSGSALTFDGTTLKSQYLNVQDFAASNDFVLAFKTNAGTQVGYVGVVSSSNNLSFTSTNSLIFSPSNSEQMRLTSTGLGIGTSSPASKLQVAASSGVAAIINNSDATNGFGLKITAGGSASARYALHVLDSTDSTSYFKISTETGQVGNVTIPTGNLGLGVTPSAWSGFGKTMEFNNAGCYVGNSGATSMQVGANNYFNGTDYIYSTSNVATRYAQSAGQHLWFTAASGTAGNAITFTQALTLDASVNLGLGETNPAAYGGFVSKYAGIGLHTNSTSGAAGLNFYEGGTGRFSLRTLNGSAGLSFYDSFNGAERARIDSSGNFLVGKTSASTTNTGFEVKRVDPTTTIVTCTNAGYYQALFNRQSDDGDSIIFQRQNSSVGSISVTTTATAYNTSSDYRLKNITGPITNSGAYIDSLNPVEGTWKADGSVFVGLIAHEVQEASRTQVATGVKDGEQMQGMDYSNSEIIANLIAEIKSLRARVAQLESN